jgi:electron transfer flavoprotein alpha subunit
VAKVWVYAEVANGTVDPAALEILTRVRDLGDADAVALGPGATAAADALGRHGAARVFVSDDPVFADFVAQPAAHALERLIREHSPDLVAFATNYDSRDIAGRLSGRIGATLMSNVVALPSLEVARTSVFGGSRFVDVELHGAPRIVLVRPKSFEARESGGSAEVVAVDAEVPDDLVAARRVERHEEAAAGPKLEDAPVVVSGGRGLGEASNFGLLEELADALGDAAVGATRAVVDAGWVPYSKQIGQTGTTIKPNIYLAFGISGATQHVVGMKGAKRIIAVNKDEDAPIFQFADLGVVGDALEILPRLIEEVKARKG